VRGVVRSAGAFWGQLKKLPIGIQTFAKIREENYLYTDKTALISKLVEVWNILIFFPDRIALVKARLSPPCRPCLKGGKNCSRV